MATPARSAAEGETMAGELISEPDSLIVEEPLKIMLDGLDVATTMRTPGHDFELAAGFLLAEGLIRPNAISSITYCADETGVSDEAAKYNAVAVSSNSRSASSADNVARLGMISASCGVCGSASIEALTERLRMLPAYEPWGPIKLASFVELLREDQPLFDQTGAVHAAAAITRAGDVIVVREDIGRHNAVDKVNGFLSLNDRLPATECALVVSSRASFEMVQKAWAGGFTALVSVSAPSALAVETARRAGMTLAGFVRNGGAKLYSPDQLF